MICIDWICRRCGGVINALLVCRACRTPYTLGELRYEWPDELPPSQVAAAAREKAVRR